MTPAGRPKAFSREEALERAMEVFWGEGYEGTSIAQLTEAMGIGRQSLYDTFGDKRRLFLAALDHYAARAIRPTIEALRGPGSGLARVNEVLDDWERANSCPDCKGCLLANSLVEFSDDEEVAAILREHVRALEGAFREALERAKEAGKLRADADAGALARALTSMGQGLSILGRVGLGGEMARDVVVMTRKLLD